MAEGNIRGGLDRYLGPEAIDSSHLPGSQADDTLRQEDSSQIDCAGKDAQQPICQIARSEQEIRQRGANAT